MGRGLDVTSRLSRHDTPSARMQRPGSPAGLRRCATRNGGAAGVESLSGPLAPQHAVMIDRDPRSNGRSLRWIHRGWRLAAIALFAMAMGGPGVAAEPSPPASHPDAAPPLAKPDSRDLRYDPRLRLLGRRQKGPGYHTRVPAGTWAHSTRDSLDYALDLLRTDEPARHVRAAHLIEAVIALQDRDPASPTFGIWPWLYEEPIAQMGAPDFNWADFCGARLLEALISHAQRLPPDLHGPMRASIADAAAAIVKRDVKPGYTNIAIMGAGVTLAAGEVLGDDRLVEYGRRRLEAFHAHTIHHGGFNEYNSPTYTVVAVEELERILDTVRDPVARTTAIAVHRLAWEMIAEHFHPGTRQWAGPHSRSYHARLTPDQVRWLESRTGVALGTTTRTAAPASAAPRRGHPCPPDLVARFQALPDGGPLEIRRRLVRRAAEADSVWGTTWMDAHACLGSVDMETLWDQRRVVLAYWPAADGPPATLRLRFLHDGRDFASAFAWSAQRGPRVLTAIGLVTDQGDFHPSLDRPKDGVFPSTDLRVRYELRAADATARSLGDGRFLVSSGGRGAVLHTRASRFAGQPVVWELGQEEGLVRVDGVCWSGGDRRLDPAAIDDIDLAVGLELLAPDARPSTEGVAGRDADDRRVFTWAVDGGLEVRMPKRSGPRPGR